MIVACPKNHYDFVKMRLPDLTGKIEKHFYGKGDSHVEELSFGSLAPYASKELDRREASGAKVRKPTVGTKVEELRKLNAPTAEIVKLQKLAKEELFLLSTFEAARVADEFEWMKTFNREGRKTFFFSETLTAKLADTEVDVDSELLTLPFPSCMFVFQGEVVKELFAEDSAEPAGGQWVASVYLRSVPLDENDGQHIRASCYLVTKKGYVLRRERKFLSEPGIKVETAIAGNGGPEDQEYLEDAGIMFARVLANSILYLTSSNPDVAPGIRTVRDINEPATQKQKRAILETLTSLAYTYVGGSSRPYVRSTKEMLRVSGRKRVRGHWKMQLHGAGGALRRLIHVEPYWRGLDAAEAVDKAYRVT